MQPEVLLPELLDQALPPGVIQQVLVGLEQSGEGEGHQPHALLYNAMWDGSSVERDFDSL